MTLQKILAANIRYLRNKKQWTAEELAARSGVDQSTISHIERGKRNANLDTIDKLAIAFEVTPDTLLIPLSHFYDKLDLLEINRRFSLIGTLSRLADILGDLS